MKKLLLLVVFLRSWLSITAFKPGSLPLPPRINNQPIEIKVSHLLDDLTSVDIKNMDFRMDYYMIEYWQVPRKTCSLYMSDLQSANVNITVNDRGSVFISPNHVNMIWAPDTFITNAKSIDMPSSEKRFSKMEIKRYGQKCAMKRVSKLTAKISCQMELKNYPFDRQLCTVWFRSCKFALSRAAN